MIKFKYIAMKSDKQKQEGFIEAETRNLALSELHAKDFVVLSLTSLGEEKKNFQQQQSETKKSLNSKDILSFTDLFKKKIPSTTKQGFFEQLGVLFDSGISVVDSIDIIAKNTQDKSFHGILMDVKREIGNGRSLSQAMSAHTDCFDKSMVALIFAGEQSGTIVLTCQRIASSIEQREEVKQKVFKALVYPVLLISIMGIVLLVFFLKIVPGFQKIFDRFNAELPQITTTFIGISVFLRKYFLFFVLAVLSAIYVIKKILNFSRFKKLLDENTLKIPIMGSMISDGNLFNISLFLSIFLQNGVSLIESLELISGFLKNSYLSSIIQDIKESIKKGESLSSQVSLYTFFPSNFIQMIWIGEETGRMVEMLDSLSKIYYKRTFKKVDIFITLFEPLALIVVGSVLGFVVISMYLPVFSIISSVGNSTSGF